MNWNDMTPRERDALVHLHVMPHDIDDTLDIEDGIFAAGPHMPRYSTDHNAVALVRAEIAQRELSRRFIIELFAIVSGLDAGPLVVSNDYVWLLLNASPAQQCLAALRAKGVSV